MVGAGHTTRMATGVIATIGVIGITAAIGTDVNCGRELRKTAPVGQPWPTRIRGVSAAPVPASTVRRSAMA